MTREKARWRTKTLMRRTTFLQTLEPCVYVHTHEDVRMCADRQCNRKMCVRQVNVCTPTVVHTVVATTCVRNPPKIKTVGKTVENEHSSLHDHLDTKKSSIRRLGSVSVCTEHFKKISDFIILCPSWSFLLVLVPSVGFSSIIVSGGFSVSRGMRLWETDLANLLIFDDAFAWIFPIVQDQRRPFELVEDHCATLWWNWVKVPRLRTTLGFPKHAYKRRSSVRPCIPECYFWSFRGLSCLCEQFSFPSSLTPFTTHSSGRDWYVMVA